MLTLYSAGARKLRHDVLCRKQTDYSKPERLGLNQVGQGSPLAMLSSQIVQVTSPRRANHSLASSQTPWERAYARTLRPSILNPKVCPLSLTRWGPPLPDHSSLLSTVVLLFTLKWSQERSRQLKRIQLKKSRVGVIVPLETWFRLSTVQFRQIRYGCQGNTRGSVWLLWLGALL